MGLTSLQVCMDSDWLQGTMHDETGMDSSSPSGDMLTCSRPLIETRLRPPHDQALKCPRCDSTHTKFCYYNNYSLSQPRYFCKTCRRYWTKGGTLRNIPVGGGCRKNKKVSKKSTENHQSTSNNNNNLGISSSSSHHNPTDLHLAFPDQVHFSHLNNILNAQGTLGNPSNFMEAKYNIGLLENPTRAPIDFIMENKLEALVGSSSSRNYDFMGNSDMGMISGLGHHHHHGLTANNYHGLCSPFGMDNGSSTFMETCQRLMLPYDHHHHQANDHDQNTIDVKPNTKLLSLEWQQDHHDGLGSSWNGMMNGYGSSTTTNPLV